MNKYLKLFDIVMFFTIKQAKHIFKELFSGQDSEQRSNSRSIFTLFCIRVVILLTVLIFGEFITMLFIVSKKIEGKSFVSKFSSFNYNKLFFAEFFFDHDSLLKFTLAVRLKHSCSLALWRIQ